MAWEAQSWEVFGVRVKETLDRVRRVGLRSYFKTRVVIMARSNFDHYTNQMEL